MGAQAGERDLRGRTLGEFVLQELIGVGGFGHVYRAEQPALSREAVVKVLKLEGARGRERFLREAKLASRLDHPFAAHVYAFGAEPDGLLWIAMEMVRGTPLSDLLRKSGPLPVARAIPFLRRLTEVIQTAHEQGIVHRDIKPANVMVLVRAGSVFPKLLDLGIAKDLGGSPEERGPSPLQMLARSQHKGGDAGVVTQVGSLGTPFYMAPEQWVDPTNAGPPADIYALGVMAYEVLTGNPPFVGDNLFEIAKQHAKSEPPTLPDSLPSGLSGVIGKAMAKREEDRFDSALEFSGALIAESGVEIKGLSLPRLDELTRDELSVAAPQPIAECAAAIDGAKSASELRDACSRAALAVSRFVAIVALGCRDRGGRRADEPAIDDLIDELSRGDLSAERWWKLSRELCRPFATISNAYPVPELVELFFAGKAEARTAMEPLLEAIEAADGASDDGDQLARAVAALGALLRSLRFLHDYRLVVPSSAGNEVWMGLRRPIRPRVDTTAPLVIGRPALVDATGTPVVSLWPAAQVLEPAPNSPPELFLFAGASHRGLPGLVADPAGYQRSDESIWGWLGVDPTADAGEKIDSPGSSGPYRGLSTFTAVDADSFFGREREVEAFVNRLRDSSLIAVVGPSGVGKSSFIQAGVVPALGDTTPIVFRPGATPITALDTALPEVPNKSSLLVVDQFEELFTLCHDDDERVRFVDRLLELAAGEAPVRVVLTLRDDFLVRAVGVPALRDALTGTLHVLATPAEDDLIRILTEPAKRVGYEFEDDDVPREMVAEVADEPGALALLSFTASRLWEFRDRHFRQLPRKAYVAIGGVGGALAQHAEATLEALDDGGQKILRELFRHLVTADGTRAVLSRDELLQVSGAGEDAEPVLEALVTARLLTAQEGAGGEERIEVVHEALLSAWPRVVGWHAEDSQTARLRDQLRAAARQWSERDRPRGLLWRGDPLTEYKLWRGRYSGAVTDVERDFARASLADETRSRRIRRGVLAVVFAGLVVALVIFAQLRSVAEENRDKAVAATDKVETQLTSSYVAQGRRALLEGDTSASLLFLSRAMARGADGPTVRFMFARALDPLENQVGTLTGHDAQLWAVRYNRDGSRIATTASDGTVRVFTATGEPVQVLSGLAKGAAEIAWHPDGRLLAAGDSAGTLRLLDTDTGAVVAVIAAHEAAILSVGFLAADRIVTSSLDGAIRQFVLDPAGTLKPSTEFRVNDWPTAQKRNPRVRATSDGTLLVVSDYLGKPSVWTAAGDRVSELVGHKGPVWYAIPSPTGDRVATSSIDATARIWDAKTGSQLHVLSGHDSRVTHVAWNRDGTRVATASADKTVKIWDASTGSVVLGLQGHSAQVNRVGFVNDKWIVTAAADGTARVWDASRGTLVFVFNHGGMVFDFDASPDGTRLATASWSGTGRLWRLDGAGGITSMAGSPGPDPYSLRRLGEDKVARLSATGPEVWTVATGEVTRTEVADPVAFAVAPSAQAVAAVGANGRLLVSRPGAPAVELAVGAGPHLVGLSPDARYAFIQRGEALIKREIESGDEVARAELGASFTEIHVSPAGPTLLLWDSRVATKTAVVDATTLSVIAELPASSAPPAYSPDGKRIAAPDSASPAVVLFGDGDSVVLADSTDAATPAWSPDGSHVLVGLSDGTVHLWSAAGKSLARVTGHDLYVVGVAFSEDGHLAATVSGDGTLKIWSVPELDLLWSAGVAPRTWWVAFMGDSIVTSDGTTLDRRSIARARIDRAAATELVRCRVPFALAGSSVVPKKLPPASECAEPAR